jgi:hypothetical protein
VYLILKKKLVKGVLSMWQVPGAASRSRIAGNSLSPVTGFIH